MNQPSPRGPWAALAASLALIWAPPGLAQDGEATTLPLERCAALTGTYVTTITDIEGVFASRGLLSFTADGLFLMTDSSQGGVPGVYAPFTAGQGAWDCRAADDESLRAHALALNFVLPVDDHAVRFARVDYEAQLDRQTGMLSGSAALGFTAEGDLEAANPLVAPGPVVEHFHVEGVRIVPHEHAIRSVRYACEDGHGFQVTFQGGEGGADAAIVQFHGGQVRLPHVPAASGARYSDGSTELWTKGEEARFTLEGGSAQHCRPQN